MQLDKCIGLYLFKVFSDESVIDWDRTVDEIDMQLYKKYRLSDNEIEYIESTIKALE